MKKYIVGLLVLFLFGGWIWFVEFVEKKSGEVFWEEKNMSNWGTYDSATQGEDDGKEMAIGKLVEDILNKTVKGW